MNKLFPIIYAQTSLGQIQTWQIEVNNSSFRTHEGIDGGVITTPNWTTCEGKNIGKKNETSPQDQALKEAAAKHKKKLESGYFESREDAVSGKTKFFEPQLAEKWSSCKDDVIYPTTVEKKYDGVCLLVGKKIKLQSRNGKPLPALIHIYEELEPIFKIYPDLVFHGEAYNHDYKDNFNKITSLARKTKKLSQQEIEDCKNILKYIIYDCYLPSKPNLTLAERRLFITDILTKELPCSKILQQSSYYVAHNEKEVENYFYKFIDEGYEGAMVKNPRAPYIQKRTKNLLKVKLFEDDEFEITNISDGRGNKAGIAATIELKTKDGIYFEAGVIGNEDYARRILNKKSSYIGKMATVKYQGFTPDGKPRFAKVKVMDRSKYE